MDLSTITVDDFKAQFPRGFPYLPVYDSETIYNSGDRVYYNGLFYDCTVNGTEDILPTVEDNWTLVSDNVDNYVKDSDIEAAFKEAQIVFNQSLFSTDEQVTLGYLYLTAHYLVHDLRAALAGVAGFNPFPVQSRSVGSVSESYGIPQTYMDNPIYSFYTQSAYGMKYLSMVLPVLVGNVGAVAGATRP